MQAQEAAGLAPAERIEFLQEMPVDIVFAAGAEGGELLLRVDGVDQHMPQPAAIIEAGFQQPGHEADRPHLAH